MPEPRPECPVCGHDESTRDDDATSTLALRDPFAVVRCAACSMRWLDPAPTDDEYSRLYDAVYFDADAPPEDVDAWMLQYPQPDESTRRFSEEYRPMREAHNARMLDTLSGAATGGRRLLEIGCGHGEFLIAARERGWDVAGVEPSAAASAVARDEHGLDVAHGTLEQLGNLDPTHEYHAVYLSHVFEHLSDPHASIEILLGQLAPGGALLIVVPNQFEAWARRAVATARRHRGGTSTLYSIHHPLFYGPRQLRAVLEEHGLTVELSTHQPYEFGSSAQGAVLRIIDRVGDRVASQGRNIEALARPS